MTDQTPTLPLADWRDTPPTKRLALLLHQVWKHEGGIDSLCSSTAGGFAAEFAALKAPTGSIDILRVVRDAGKAIGLDDMPANHGGSVLDSLMMAFGGLVVHDAYVVAVPAPAEAAPTPLSLAQVKDLAERAKADGRAPEDLEASGQRDLLASYVLRDERGTAEDVHEKRHLAAMIEVGNSGRCRGFDCVIEGGHVGDRIKLSIDAPYDGRTSDFDAREASGEAPTPSHADCPDCGGSGFVTGIDADPLPSGEPGEPYQVQIPCDNAIHAFATALTEVKPLTAAEAKALATRLRSQVADARGLTLWGDAALRVAATLDERDRLF